MTTSTEEKPQRTARRRLLDAADELFYAEGVQTVGIDRIIEHAGVAKASLYNSFGSKEELVAAYLDERADRIRARLSAAVARVDDPRKKILAIFDAQAAVVETRGYRGCAFVAAATEAPRGGMVEQTTDDQRGWIRNLFTDLAAEAGARRPRQLAEQLQMIYDGCSISVRMDRDPAIVRSARVAAAALLDSQL